MSDHLLVERQGAVATVVLNKPQSHNAISIVFVAARIVAHIDVEPESILFEGLYFDAAWIDGDPVEEFGRYEGEGRDFKLVASLVFRLEDGAGTDDDVPIVQRLANRAETLRVWRGQRHGGPIACEVGGLDSKWG